jgi:hypothetical protein
MLSCSEGRAERRVSKAFESEAEALGPERRSLALSPVFMLQLRVQARNT